MIQGTTPTHTFNIPLDLSTVSNLSIVYAQHGAVILKKEKEDCTIAGNHLTLKLMQEETLKFDANAPVQIQIRILTAGGDALASDVMRVPCAAVLDKVVLE